MQNPSSFNHIKIRPENTKHTLHNNKDLTPDLDGQFIPDNYRQGYWLFH
jgi:hypothetical protein